MKQTTVKPAGQHRARMVQNVGRDEWHYNGEMEQGQVQHNGQVVDVWFFQWAKVADRDVRDHMLRAHAMMRGMTLAAARKQLLSIKSAVPVLDVMLVVDDEQSQ